ncbi:MAG: aminodeoxychorismate synthase component I [Calditrichaceae bacterium]|nr:aminodeoxychorismate synthase component I [Calditrichaceae bacterium]MBN2710008.1 aminodeoxychorismate synthase component I [Calditrichaceae bacterium]RQV97345.1 MAG: aminodeoxychorismate synthase component I [Calditrichota bacterium]
MQTPEIIIHDAFTRQWLKFVNPVRLYEIKSSEDVIPALMQIERLVRLEKLYATGFVAYEAASAFDNHLLTFPPSDLPLLYFGLFKDAETTAIPANSAENFHEMIMIPDIDAKTFNKKISKIKDYICQGWTYQVNYTFRLNRQAVDFIPKQIFGSMISAQPSDYGAYIETERFSVCSASPELFFMRDGNRITSIPMKGTAPRGKTLNEDELIRNNLYVSEKNRAENLMIVDMIRNDLSKVCVYGSVKVPELFKIEKYPTVWQMVSKVTGVTDAGIADIFKALFPCASITGAPKVKTMSIIRELEESPRNIYTGAIGFIKPDGKSQFNVAIRTLLFDHQAKTVEYGIGSGIVWDSKAEDEYEECLLKSRVLKTTQPGFDLLETMRVDKGGAIFLLDYHLKRVQDSADYFDFPFDREKILKYLKAQLKEYTMLPCIIRLLLSKKGEIKIELKPLSPLGDSGEMKVAIAKTPVNKEDVFLYHKTTWRKIYENAIKDFPGYADVILWNKDHEITESTIANIVIEQHGNYYTPPVSCGLLNGTYRQWLIDKGKLIEKVIKKEELYGYHKIFLINSVREWQQVYL